MQLQQVPHNYSGASLSFLFEDDREPKRGRLSLRKRQQKMKARHSASISEDAPKIVEFNLGEAARVLCLTQGCGRYSCGAGDVAIFPSTKSKRKGTSTRMTWKITPADIAAIRLAMRTT